MSIEKLVKEVGSVLICLAVFSILHFGINSPQTNFFMGIIEQINNVMGWLINTLFHF